MICKYIKIFLKKRVQSKIISLIVPALIISGLSPEGEVKIIFQKEKLSVRYNYLNRGVL